MLNFIVSVSLLFTKLHTWSWMLASTILTRTFDLRRRRRLPRRDPHQTLVLLLLRDRTARHQKVGRRESLRAPARFRRLRQRRRAKSALCAGAPRLGMRPGAILGRSCPTSRPPRARWPRPRPRATASGLASPASVSGRSRAFEVCRAGRPRSFFTATAEKYDKMLIVAGRTKTRRLRAFVSRPPKGVSLGSREAPSGPLPPPESPRDAGPPE